MKKKQRVETKEYASETKEGCKAKILVKNTPAT